DGLGLVWNQEDAEPVGQLVFRDSFNRDDFLEGFFSTGGRGGDEAQGGEKQGRAATNHLNFLRKSGRHDWHSATANGENWLPHASRSDKRGRVLHRLGVGITEVGRNCDSRDAVKPRLGGLAERSATHCSPWAFAMASDTSRPRAPLRKASASRLHDSLATSGAPDYQLEGRSHTAKECCHRRRMSL